MQIKRVINNLRILPTSIKDLVITDFHVIFFVRYSRSIVIPNEKCIYLYEITQPHFVTYASCNLMCSSMNITRNNSELKKKTNAARN